MSIPTKAWLILCAVILYSCGVWYSGYHSCDKNWQLKEAERNRTESDNARNLSEEYRKKEQKLNERIGYLETKGINDSAAAEMELKAVTDRLLNPGRHPGDGLRVKPSLTCNVSNSPGTTGNSDAEIQTGVSVEIAGDIIGTGGECDQAVISLSACQEYVSLLPKECGKPLE